MLASPPGVPVAAVEVTASLLQLDWRPYRFRLPQALVTAQGALVERRGWLLRLQADTGALGWGEAALLPPGAPDPEALALTIDALPRSLDRRSLEALLPALSLPLQAAVGLALAEVDGLGSEVSEFF